MPRFLPCLADVGRERTELQKAIVQDRYGSADVLEFTDVDKPVAAVNAADWHVMRGDPYVARLMLPAVFGFGGLNVELIRSLGAETDRWATTGVR